MDSNVNSQLGVIRRTRGIAAAELARRVNVTRQTIYAIEAGTYVPNTEVTLKLARELDVSVEDLFSLKRDVSEKAKPLRSEVLSAALPTEGDSVQLCRVGERLLSVPVNASPYFLPEADGVITHAAPSRRRGDVLVCSNEDTVSKRLIVAGCDPAIGLLAPMVARMSGVEVVCAPASSTLALTWLRAGKVHIAGMHLKDSRTGEFNVPIIHRELADKDATVVTFARWQEGIVTAHGNPKQIKDVSHLARRGVTFVNRESGSGSRALLDALLGTTGLAPKQVAGYDRIAQGHLAAAWSVYSGQAHCCIATASAARAFRLDFIPLQSERYDFVLRRDAMNLPAVQHFLNALQKASLRRKLEVLAGYDTAQTGTVVV